jgi:hypothetical protein
MRATIRLADGSVVEGEVVAIGNWWPRTSNAAACAPGPSVIYADVTLLAPAGAFPPPVFRVTPDVAGCARPPEFSVFTIPAT